MNAFFVLPPGGTTEMLKNEIAAPIVERLRPYMEHEKQPYIRGYNLSAFGSFNGMFVYPQDPGRVEGDDRDRSRRDPRRPARHQGICTAIVAAQLRFRWGDGAINVDLQGSDINALSEIAMKAMPIVNEAVPGAQVRPIPGLAIAEPELQLVPDDRRITAAGLDRASVATVVRATTSGSFVGGVLRRQ